MLKKLNIDINSDWEQTLATMIIEKYSKYYSELERNKDVILQVLKDEKLNLIEHLKRFKRV